MDLPVRRTQSSETQGLEGKPDSPGDDSSGPATRRGNSQVEEGRGPFQRRKRRRALPLFPADGLDPTLEGPRPLGGNFGRDPEELETSVDNVHCPSSCRSPAGEREPGHEEDLGVEEKRRLRGGGGRAPARRRDGRETRGLKRKRDRLAQRGEGQAERAGVGVRT